MASKFRNVKTIVDGVTYDSKKEMRRHLALALAEQAGVISNLRRQVKYELHALGGLKVCTYIADHVYEQDGLTVVEDTKSPVTAKNPVYRLKKRWMKAEHGIEIREW